MNSYKLNASQNTPEVNLDPKNNIFEVIGRSSPEDAASFYFPILEWVDKYLEHPNKETILNFKLPYYNTSSSKLILTIMTKFETAFENGQKVKINWFYPQDDEDILEAGEEYSDIVDIPFEYIAY